MRNDMRRFTRQAGFSIIEAVLGSMLLLAAFFVPYLLDKAQRSHPDNWGRGLPSNDTLQSGLSKAGSSSLLYEMSVDAVELSCEDSKVAARFAFEPMDGREQVKVTSATLCREEGPMVAWHGYRVLAKENYDAALVDQQLKKFIADAGIKKNEAAGYNDELAKKIHQVVAKKLTLDENMRVRFSCSKAQSPYQYSVLHPTSPRVPDGTVKTLCVKAHQNFEMTIVGNYRTDGSPVLVTQYNALDEARAVQAVTEYVAQTQASVKKSF